MVLLSLLSCTNLRVGAASGSGLKAHQLALLDLCIGWSSDELGLQVLAGVVAEVVRSQRGRLLLRPGHAGNK